MNVFKFSRQVIHPSIHLSIRPASQPASQPANHPSINPSNNNVTLKTGFIREKMNSVLIIIIIIMIIIIRIIVIRMIIIVQNNQAFNCFKMLDRSALNQSFKLYRCKWIGFHQNIFAHWFQWDLSFDVGKIMAHCNIVENGVKNLTEKSRINIGFIHPRFYLQQFRFTSSIIAAIIGGKVIEADK